MKTDFIQQEILLVTTTTFSQRQYCETDDKSHDQHISDMEQLEAACWNGLLDKALPEISEKYISGKKLSLWHIRNGASFLQIELGEFSAYVEMHLSIDTNFFLSEIRNN